MNVKELRDILNSLPDDMLVVMSSDSEGNAYSPLSGHAVGKYMANSTWDGQYYDNLDYIDEIKEGYLDEEDEVVDAVCIWPTN